MAAVDLPIAAVEDYGDEITAALTVVAALVLARLLDRAIANRGRRLTTAVVGGDLSPVASTRLRLVRRLVFVAILVVGVFIALSQFESLKRVATGVLASSAVLGLVVGFAARQTLANAVAGILLAISQPIRIGDLVTFEEETGTVEDIQLTYTYLRAGDGSRIVVPNERLASSTIHNHTIVDPRVRVEVSLWIPLDADAGRALSALAAEPDTEAEVAEVDKEGIRLSVGQWAESASARAPTAARLRASCLERLRAEGLLSG